jgi:hypothetical protein
MPATASPSAGDEGPRAVNRIDDPDMRAGTVLGAKLLTQDAVVRILRVDDGADRLFGLAVGLGDRVEAGFQLVGHRTLAAESRQRLGSGRIGDLAEERRAYIQS